MSKDGFTPFFWAALLTGCLLGVLDVIKVIRNSRDDENRRR
jgi:hypothetical protein